MSYWWYRHANRTGIVPAETPIELSDGIAIHAALERLGQAPDPLAEARALVGASEAPETDSERERWIRWCGWVLAWAKWIEPSLRAQFETLMFEHELVVQHKQLLWSTTPDRVMRERTTGRVVVEDYKTAATTWGWAGQWPFAIQVHIQLLAVQQELGEPVAYGRMRAIHKGVIREGRLAHPYAWAYRDRDGAWYSEWKTGLSHAPVWEYEDGIEAWVDRLGEEIGQSLLSLSQPIFLNERLVEKLLDQRERRESEISAMLKECHEDEAVRDQHFEYHFSQCRPGGGRRQCGYIAACHNATVGAAPLASGLFVPRIPHHELERVGVIHEDFSERPSETQ